MNTMPLQIRRAAAGEEPAIRALIDELEVGHPSIPADAFFVAIVDGRIVGTANLEDRGSCCYLSAVGVRRDRQGQGIATQLLRFVFEGVAKDIYLYTRIPAFFARLGFVPAEAPREIPSREVYACCSCDDRARCGTMVRRAGHV